jgi:hypothetical protein
VSGIFEDFGLVEEYTPPVADGLDPFLVSRLHRLANRARVLAEAPAGSWSASHATNHGSKILSRDEPAVLDRIAERASKIVTNEDLADVVAWAEALVESVARAATAPPPETPAEFRRRVCIQYMGQPASAIVRGERVSKTLARRIRQEGFDGRRFQAIDGVEITQED